MNGAFWVSLCLSMFACIVEGGRINGLRVESITRDSVTVSFPVAPDATKYDVYTVDARMAGGSATKHSVDPPTDDEIRDQRMTRTVSGLTAGKPLTVYALAFGKKKYVYNFVDAFTDCPEGQKKCDLGRRWIRYKCLEKC